MFEELMELHCLEKCKKTIFKCSISGLEYYLNTIKWKMKKQILFSEIKFNEQILENN
jgi:hypothetical protein